MIEITYIIPCLNEEDNVSAISSAVINEAEKLGLSYEIIFIDNGSSDETVNIVKGLCRRNSAIRLIVNNKNYGQLRSPTYAIFQAQGRAIIGISADFQDPPNLIPEFIARWRAGFEIVLAVRESERSSLLLRVLRAIGYGFFARFADYKVISGATGFGLYDAKVVRQLAQWNEPEPFFRGMLVETGFSLSTISYKRPGRSRGITKNNFITLLDFAITGLGATSRKMLRLPFYVSLAIAIILFALLVFTGIAAIMGVNVLLHFLILSAGSVFCALFFCLGLIGEQVRLIAQSVRGVPLVIEKERINFENDHVVTGKPRGGY